MRWWRRDARDAELTEELQAHLEMAVEQRIECGESPAEARTNALREFGNITHVAEVTRETWGGATLDAFLRDVRYAARGLRRSPTFTAIPAAGPARHSLASVDGARTQRSRSGRSHVR